MYVRRSKVGKGVIKAILTNKENKKVGDLIRGEKHEGTESQQHVNGKVPGMME